jgi:hypothetical protein
MRFADKRYICELSLIHISLTLSLLYFAQYSFILFFQLSFFAVIFEYKRSFLGKMIFFVYLMCLNYSLALLFCFALYNFYFIALFGISYFLYNQQINFTKKELLACGIFALGTIALLRYFEGTVFDLYLYLDMSDEQNFINVEVYSLLTLLHLSILFFTFFKKNRRLFGI